MGYIDHKPLRPVDLFILSGKKVQTPNDKYMWIGITAFIVLTFLITWTGLLVNHGGVP